MGLACGAPRDKCETQSETAEMIFVQHLLEETRSQGSYRKTASVMAVSDFENLLKSASNYWINKKSYNVTGSNRPMFEYGMHMKMNLMKIDQSVFTIQEKKAAIRIQRWWKRRQERIRQARRKSQLTMRRFFR